MIRYDKVIYPSRVSQIKKYWLLSIITLVLFLIVLVIISNLYFIKTFSLTAVATAKDSLKIIFPSNQEDLIYKSNTINIGSTKVTLDSIEVVGNQLNDGILLTEANLKTSSFDYLENHYYEVSFEGSKENLWDYLISYGKGVVE